jgi:hypothetical protein
MLRHLSACTATSLHLLALCRTHSSAVSKAFLKVLALDVGHLLLAKAYCEGQTAAAVSIACSMAVSVNAQVPNLPPALSRRNKVGMQGCRKPDF